MLKAIVSPSFRLLMAVTRLVLPALKSVLSAVLTVMVAARRVATDAATAVTAKRERSFFIKFLRCEGLPQLSVQEDGRLPASDSRGKDYQQSTRQVANPCARRCNSSRNAWMSGDVLPGQSAASVTGRKPSSGKARILGESLGRGTATDKPMP